MGLFGCKVLGTTLVNVYLIMLCLDVGTDMGSFDGYFDCSTDGNLEGVSLGKSLVST